MLHRALSHRVNAKASPLALVLALTAVACSSDQNGGTGINVDPTSSSGAQTTTGASNETTSASTTTGQTGATSGAASTSGASGTSSGSGSTTGASGSSGSSGNSSGASGASTSDTSAGSDSTSGPSGSTTSSGDPSSTSGESTGPVECTRALLDSLADAFFAALSAGDPSSLPLAPNVKFTENAEQVEIGSTEFWDKAGDTKHSQRALDTTQCSVAAQAVIPEGATDRPVGLRIKVEDGKMTEIETIVVREGDYTGSFAVPSEPQDIITIAEQVGWHDEIPEAERATREQLSGWIDKYFRAFPQGVCNVSSACRRLENGGGGNPGELGFSCGAGASCTNNVGQNAVFEPRVIIVDEVRGIAAGFTIFDFMIPGHLDMHMMKMSGGEVHAVHAILRNTNGESGWD